MRKTAVFAASVFSAALLFTFNYQSAFADAPSAEQKSYGVPQSVREPAASVRNTQIEKPEWIKRLEIVGAALYAAEHDGLYDIDVEACVGSMYAALSGVSLPSSAAKEPHTIPSPIFPKTEEGKKAKEDAVKEDKLVCFDQFSGILFEDEAKFRQEEIEGEFGGIGAELREENGKVIIHSLFENGPAFRAGLKQGDIIRKVRDDKNSKDVPVTTTAEAVQKIRGEVGTAVVLTIERDGKEDVVTLTREIVQPNAVKAKSVSGGAGYVRLESFTARSSDELEEAITSLNLPGPRPKLILDLRGNPGGILYSAQKILFYFSNRPDDVLTTTRRRRGAVEVSGQETIRSMMGKFVNSKTGAVKSPGIFERYAVVVLIDEYSASASEIVAGTLQGWGKKHGRFSVVGKPSLGKSVGQHTIPLRYGAELNLTTFEYMLGNDVHSIQGVGVIPDTEIEDTRYDAEGKFDSSLTATDKDAQFTKALEILSRIQ